MLAGLIALAALAAGFGIPFSALGLGAAMAVGVVLTLLGFFVATVFAGLGLDSAGWVVAGLAASTFGATLLVRPPKPSAEWIVHPVWGLPALIVAVALIQGVPPYVAVNWDEMSAWALWPREILAAGSWRGADRLMAYASYTKGWPILAAGITRLLGRDDLAPGIGVAAFWHISTLAATYDLAMALLARRAAWAGTTARATAWVLVLILLLGEATWKLVPHSYLVEQQEIYATAVFFILATLAVQAPQADSRRSLAFLAAGLALAGGYAVKTPLATLAVPAAVFLAAGRGGRLRHGVALGLPLIVIVAGWTLAQPHKPGATALPLEALARISPAQVQAVMRQLAQEFTAYVATWKLPMTAFGVVGLGLAARSEDAASRTLAWAMVAFCAVFFAGLVPLYLVIVTPSGGDLPSLPRYIDVPLRVVHLLGCLLGGLDVLSRPPLQGLWRHRHAVAGMIALAGAAMAVEGWRVAADIAAMTEHPDFGRASYALVRDTQARAVAVTRTVEAMGGPPPKLLVIDQGGDGFTKVILNYVSVRPPGHAAATAVHALQVTGGWNFAPAGEDAFDAEMRQADILWTYRLDPWTRSQLARLAPDCAGRLDGRLLVRDEAGSYRCHDIGP